MSTPARSEPDGRRASLSGTKRPLAPVSGNVGVPSPAPEIEKTNYSNTTQRQHGPWCTYWLQAKIIKET